MNSGSKLPFDWERETPRERLVRDRLDEMWPRGIDFEIQSGAIVVVHKMELVTEAERDSLLAHSDLYVRAIELGICPDCSVQFTTRGWCSCCGKRRCLARGCVRFATNIQVGACEECEAASLDGNYPDWIY